MCLRAGLASLLGSLLAAASAYPVQALARMALRLPSLQTSITVNLGQARSADELIRLSPYLLELQSASHGAVLGVLQQLFFLPLPLQTMGFFAWYHEAATLRAGFGCSDPFRGSSRGRDRRHRSNAYASTESGRTAGAPPHSRASTGTAWGGGLLGPVSCCGCPQLTESQS